MSTLVLIFTGLAMLYRLCKPFGAITTVLFTSMLAFVFVCIFVWPGVFGIMPVFDLGVTNILFIMVLSLLSPTVITILYRLMDKVKL